MQRVVLVSGHYLGSKRKAGFHWLADAYHRNGADVFFMTTGLSWLSYLRRDYRLSYPVRREANRCVQVGDRLTSYAWFTPWHPANLRADLLNRLTHSTFARYGDLPLGPAEEAIRRADLVIVESTPGLLLTERIRAINGRARLVYRVSDDLHRLRCHPVVIEAEPRLAGLFDRVSVPCEYIRRRLSNFSQVRLHHHALDKRAFDSPLPNPYAAQPADVECNCVFVGNAQFDCEFLERAARMFPAWRFHIIGPIAGVPRPSNVTAYGELPFAETVPYVAHADIGLQTLRHTPGSESFTDSLKVIQYTYCRLPIVAPEFLRCGRTNMHFYRPGDDASIRAALEDARATDRGRIDRSGILSWDELAQTLASD